MECRFFFSFPGTQCWSWKINHPVHTLIMAGCRHASEDSPSSPPPSVALHHLHFTCSFHLPLPIHFYAHLLLSCSDARLSFACSVWFAIHTSFIIVCPVFFNFSHTTVSLCLPPFPSPFFVVISRSPLLHLILNLFFK